LAWYNCLSQNSKVKNGCVEYIHHTEHDQYGRIPFLKRNKAQSDIDRVNKRHYYEKLPLGPVVLKDSQAIIGVFYLVGFVYLIFAQDGTQHYWEGKIPVMEEHQREMHVPNLPNNSNGKATAYNVDKYGDEAHRVVLLTRLIFTIV